MSDTLLFVVSTIVILLLVLVLVYFLRRNADITIEGSMLVLRKPFGSQQKIDLEEELDRWSVQKYRLILWRRTIHGITMRMKNGKQLTVNSRFNYESYQHLYQLLESKFQERQHPAP